jgi:hypothetical protein
MPAISSCQSPRSSTCSPHKGGTMHLLLSHSCSGFATEPGIIIVVRVRFDLHVSGSPIGGLAQAVDGFLVPNGPLRFLETVDGFYAVLLRRLPCEPPSSSRMPSYRDIGRISSGAPLPRGHGKEHPEADPLIVGARARRSAIDPRR